jgi:hypothetical protein
LTKGPYGLLFPLIVAVLVSFRRKDFRRPRFGEWLTFAATFALLLSLWVVPVYLRDHGVYLKRVIFQPDLVTMASGMAGSTRRSFYWYLGPAPLYFLPWTLFLPFVFLVARRYAAAPYIALAIFVVLSCVPGKRENYLGPWFPFAMLAVTSSIMRREERLHWVKASSRVLLGLMTISIPLYYGWVEPRFMGPSMEPERVFAEKVMEAVPEGSTIIGFRGMGEAVSFINFERGRPHVVSVSETRPPDKLLLLVERALSAGKPCYVMVMNRDLRIALDALRDERVELVFEREVKKREFWKLYHVLRK